MVADGISYYRAAAEAWIPLDRKLKEANGNLRHQKTVWKYWGQPFINRMKDLCFWVLKHKQPPANVRRLDLIVKPFLSMRGNPRDPVAWIDKHAHNIEVVFKSYRWEDRADGVEEVAGFRVHNLAGLTDDKLADIRKLVVISARAIKGSGLPKVSSLFYGDIYITNELLGGTTLAFYRRAQDTIWLHPKTRFGPASEHSLIHEVGHRYWAKVLPTSAKRAWKVWDSKLRAAGSYKQPDFVWPEPGERLPFRVSGHGKLPPVVLRVDRSGRTVKFYISNNGYVTLRQLQTHYKKESLRAQFPTPYAEQGGSEEHFCEAFSLYCQGKLEEPHQTAFREAVT